MAVTPAPLCQSDEQEAVLASTTPACGAPPATPDAPAVVPLTSDMVTATAAALPHCSDSAGALSVVSIWDRLFYASRDGVEAGPQAPCWWYRDMSGQLQVKTWLPGPDVQWVEVARETSLNGCVCRQTG